MKNQIKGIKYYSTLPESGIGIAASHYMRGILKSGIPITWSPIEESPLGIKILDEKTTSNGELSEIINKKIDYDTVIIHDWRTLQIPYLVYKERDKRVVIYFVWETERIPDAWVPIFNLADLVLVPAEWNRNTLIKCGVKTQIGIVPHIFDEGSLSEGQPLLEIDHDQFVFYTIGEWSERKAIFKTLACYLDTFSGDDRTLLVIKTGRKDLRRNKGDDGQRYFGSTKNAVDRILSGYRNPAKVLLLDCWMDRQNIAGLHQRGDCYISLCRSEGWGLGAFEAAGLGKPVIMTSFGGQGDFLDKINSYPVDYTLTPISVKKAWKHYTGKGQLWADPDVKQASEIMRQIFIDREEALHRGKILKEDIKDKFCESAVIEALIGTLPVDPDRKKRNEYDEHIRYIENKTGTPMSLAEKAIYLALYTGNINNSEYTEDRMLSWIDTLLKQFRKNNAVPDRKLVKLIKIQKRILDKRIVYRTFIEADKFNLKLLCNYLKHPLWPVACMGIRINMKFILKCILYLGNRHARFGQYRNALLSIKTKF